MDRVSRAYYAATAAGCKRLGEYTWYQKDLKLFPEIIINGMRNIRHV